MNPANRGGATLIWSISGAQQKLSKKIEEEKYLTPY